jgi:prepilin-type processing-associated H-X9-DG protein
MLLSNDGRRKVNVANAHGSARRDVSKPDSQAGCTMIELLAVIGTISILSSLLLPALARGKETSRRTSCSQNVRQLAMASLMYAQDDSRGSLSGKTGSGDQNLNWLNTGYVESRQTFVCPSTRNSVRTNIVRSELTGETGLADLFKLANTKGKGYGSSYHGFGTIGAKVETYEDIPYFGTTRTINGVRKSLNNINGYTKYHAAFGLKGTHPGPSNFWIILDNTYPGQAFYPDGGDNHGSAGGNVGFCDGHVEWVKASAYVYRYELSQDENRTGILMTW